MQDHIAKVIAQTKLHYDESGEKKTIREVSEIVGLYFIYRGMKTTFSESALKALGDDPDALRN